MRFRTRSAAALIAAIAACAATATSRGQGYTLTTINPDGVPLSTSIGRWGIEGQLIGHDIVPDREPALRAFLWEDGDLSWLDGPTGMGEFIPGRPRSREVVPGSVGSGQTGYRAALLSHGAWVFGDPLPGWRDAGAWVVLDNGDWVGVCRHREGPGDILTAATIWRDGAPTELVPTDSTTGTSVLDALADGRILGSTWSIAGDPTQYWIWNEGERTPVGNPEGYTWRRLLGFDEDALRGIAVADDGSLRVVRAGGDGVEVIASVPDAYSHYLAVTDFDSEGRFVGFSYDQWSRPLPLLWDGAAFLDLRDFIDPASGWDIAKALSLDESGRIAGVGWGGGGDAYRAFLMTPVPGPAGITAIGLAGACAGVRRSRRATHRSRGALFLSR